MALTKVQKELVTTDSLNPTGAILMFAGSVAPTGWLLCDGTEYSKTLYPELSAVLSVGNTFPHGQTNGSGGVGTTHFKVPDCRGVFVRGVGSQTINGTSYTGALGAKQGDQMQGHIHKTSSVAQAGLAGANNYGTGPYPVNNTELSSAAPASDGSNGTPRTGAETRPANIALNYIIKY